MSDTVTFYLLRKKFLEQESDIPASEEVQQVLYYSLAIGHHVGIIDCLQKIFECPLEGYRDWINFLPEGEAKRKMFGLIKFGEIIVDTEHLVLLGESWHALKGTLPEPYKQWTENFLEILAGIAKEPAMYLMIKLPRRLS